MRAGPCNRNDLSQRLVRTMYLSLAPSCDQKCQLPELLQVRSGVMLRTRLVRTILQQHFQHPIAATEHNLRGILARAACGVSRIEGGMWRRPGIPIVYLHATELPQDIACRLPFSLITSCASCQFARGTAHPEGEDIQGTCKSVTRLSLSP